jgi:CBS domain containing-hemolysin-like protein
MSGPSGRSPEERAHTRLSALAGWLRGLIGARGVESSLRETLEDVIEEHEESLDALVPAERDMLVNVLSIHETRVEDVMVPRADIVAIDVDTSLVDLMTSFRTEAHSRLPIFRGNLDDPLGMILLKDVMIWIADKGLDGAAKAVADFSVEALKRDVLFVPSSMPALDLLLKMRQTRIHMALVIDEYGGTDGLVTIEDLVEEIVGDIKDEHEDFDEPMLSPLGDGSYEADARVAIDDAAATLGLTLALDDEESVDTLGGLVVALVGGVPLRGDRVHHPAGLEIEILDADPRRVKRLRLHRATQGVSGIDSVDG